MAERVGSLYVAVGVDGKQALLEAKKLEAALYKIKLQIDSLGKHANFAGVTAGLRAVNAQAAATQKNLAAGTNVAAVQTAQAKILQQQINNAHTAALAEDKVRAQATAKALAAQQAAAQKAANMSAAQAKRSAQQQTATQAKAARDREMIMLREAYAMNKIFDKEAKSAEKAALREIAAAKLAAHARAGALKRGGADLASGAAAAASGNLAYAGANVAQGLVKMSGAIGGGSKALLGISLGFGVAAAAGLAFEGVVAGITLKVAEFGISTAASFETLQIQLEGLLGSAAAGKEELDFLLNLGQTSIVPTESLIAASRQLAAFGVENTKQRRELITFISDFGTATSATEQQIYFLALAVGQVAARGKADMVDLKQLGNAGVKTLDIYKAVGAEIGKPWQTVRDGVKDGIITADLLISALSSLDERYAETAKKAMTSTNGLIANIKDIVTVGIGNAFKALNKQVGSVLLEIQNTLKLVDFTHIAQAVQNAVDNIKLALGGIPDAGDATKTFFEQTLPDAIAFVGRDIATFVKDVRVAILAVQVAGLAVEVAMHAVAASVLTIAIAVYDSVNLLTLGMGGLIDSATLKIRDTLVAAQQDAAASGNAAIDALIIKNAELDALWKTPVNKPLTYTITAAGPFNSAGMSKAAIEHYTPKPPKPEKDPFTPGGSSGSSATKVDPMIQIMKDRIAVWKELVDQSIKGRDALREAFTVPFASKQPSKAFEAFTSGEVDSIVSQYTTIRQGLEDFYAVAEAKGGKAGKDATARRKSDIAFLKAQTGALVALADQRAKIMQDMKDREDLLTVELDAIDTRRADLAEKYAARMAYITQSYDGFFTATSSSEGTWTQGWIETSQKALDTATSAYEAAQSKLDDLRAARDDFLETLRDMAVSFVNDLSKVNEEITRFTRLDSVGSFSQVTEEIANTQSFTSGLKDRLQALKDFAANIQTLAQKGLDKGLVQTLLTGGPDANGALATALAGASSAEIADINAVQADLATTIAGLQADSSAQWFDAGIAAQEAFTAPLKAAMDAAAAQVTYMEEQKRLALGILEAWNADQAAMLDAESAAAQARYDSDKAILQAALDANTLAAETTALVIDARLNGLPTTAYASGLNTIQGLINGLSDSTKLEELKTAAEKMARIIKNRVNSVLDINSPSGVMIESGKNVGLGLSIGMGLSEPLVSQAASSMASSAMGSLDGTSSQRNTMVKVYIGDQELKDLVDMRVEAYDGSSLDYVVAGRRF